MYWHKLVHGDFLIWSDDLIPEQEMSSNRYLLINWFEYMIDLYINIYHSE